MHGAGEEVLTVDIGRQNFSIADNPYDRTVLLEQRAYRIAYEEFRGVYLYNPALSRIVVLECLILIAGTVLVACFSRSGRYI